MLERVCNNCSRLLCGSSLCVEEQGPRNAVVVLALNRTLEIKGEDVTSILLVLIIVPVFLIFLLPAK